MSTHDFCFFKLIYMSGENALLSMFLPFTKININSPSPAHNFIDGMLQKKFRRVIVNIY